MVNGHKYIIITVAATVACLLIAAALLFSRRTHSALIYNGKSIEYWEAQAVMEMPRGNYEKAIRPVVEKMGPEAIPFWLEKLQTKDSFSARSYLRLWSGLPVRLKAALPEPIPQFTRRNVAHQILSTFYYSNGIPALIDLSYSKDPELQYYAIQLLYNRGYHFYEPSTECIAAFCSALKAAEMRTRRWAVKGLGILPLRPEALPALNMALEDPDEEIRVEAAKIIVILEPRRDLTHVFEAGTSSSNSYVRATSRTTLSQLKQRPKTPPIDPAAAPL